MARGNLAAVRGAVGACKEAERWAAARRRKSPTSEVDVRLDLHPVGTATEGSTLVRDLTRPLKDSLRSRPVRAGARRSRASGAEAASGRSSTRDPRSATGNRATLTTRTSPPTPPP